MVGKPIVDQLVQAATTCGGTTDRFDHLTQGILSIALLGKGARTPRPLPIAHAHYAGEAIERAVGFSQDAVGSAYQGMRSGGGHAIRHLRDEGLIPNNGNLASQVTVFENLTTPILTAPTRTFDWPVGGTRTRAFAGAVRGRQVVVFVAKEGPYQGRILTAVVPDPAQVIQWGLS